jgi:hypothetical protein
MDGFSATTFGIAVDENSSFTCCKGGITAIEESAMPSCFFVDLRSRRFYLELAIQG